MAEPTLLARHRIPGPLWLLPVSLILAGCGSEEGQAVQQPAGDCTDIVAAQQCARILASGDELAVWPEDDGRDSPVVLYVDRSGSIKGFLDPDFPRSRIDYRAVIDGLVVGLQADSAFSFGEQLRRAPLSNAALHERSFYDDSDTRMEHALARIASDSGLTASHVIVGDGRRGSTAAANGQFSQIRDLAQRWTGAGGTFMAAASLAPFRPVEGDPAGCRDGSGEGERDSCPLYAFAFIAPGAEVELGSALAQTFQHLFTWPTAAVRPGNLVVKASSGGAVAVHPAWTTSTRGDVVARSSSPEHQSVPTVVNLVLRDSTSARGSLEAALLRGHELTSDVAVRRLSLPAQEWSPAPAQGSLVRKSADDPRELGLISFGASSPGYVYRIDLRSAGAPSWLEEFDAASATDALRTFGLRWLFTGFQAAAPSAQPLGRVFIVAY